VYQRRRISILAAATYSVPSTQYLVLAALLFQFLALPTIAVAQSHDDPVETGKQALNSNNRYPWYDRRQDDVRRLNVLPRPSNENRGATWTGSPTTTSAAPPPRRMPQVSFFGGVLQWIGLTALVLLLGLIAYLIATSFLKDEVSESDTVRKVVESRRDADRVEALPFHVRAASGDFLAEARRHYDAGRYSDAIVYLFSYQLVQLDKHHVIRLAKGKTNRQYVRETRQRPVLKAILETTMIAFEDAFFGNKQLSQQEFERSWQQVNEFQAELQREELAAA
jgi:hypothetical protein